MEGKGDALFAITIPEDAWRN